MSDRFPFDWYWCAQDGRVFSSRRQQTVAENDADYLEWSGANRATPWPGDDSGEQTEAALQDVLGPYGVYVSLPALKAALKVQVDAAAERERGKYITAGGGQAMTYQQKASEAVMLEDDPAPDPAAYPLLAAEIGITAGDLAGVGAVVRTNHAAWLTVGAAIEAVRLGTKAAITAAADEAAAIEAATATWPSPPEHTP